ncbi:MAG: hypothetical protein ACUVQS_02255 [Candidatus Bipolaricaulaceae bacterium]
MRTLGAIAKGVAGSRHNRDEAKDDTQCDPDPENDLDKNRGDHLAERQEFLHLLLSVFGPHVDATEEQMEVAGCFRFFGFGLPGRGCPLDPSLL